MTDSTTGRARPLVAVGYGPRCVPVMQLAEAAAGVCDLLWMIDTAVPGMGEMADLLNRFGAVVDLKGMSAEQAFKTLADWEPDGMTTYLDAGMVELARVAEDLGLPFHSPATAAALTDKAHQRRALAAAGLDVPPCHLVRPDQSEPELSAVEAEVGWPAVLKPRSAQGSRYTFLVRDRAELKKLLVTLGPGRPEMVLEGYLADDPARAGDPYAGYVSVESVVADGVISHLALTGRFPPAGNFRETGFSSPPPSTPGAVRPCWIWPPGPSTLSGYAPGACTPRSSSHPTGPASSRSTDGWAAVCPRCWSGPPASACSTSPCGWPWASRCPSTGPWPPTASATASSSSRRPSRPR